jgi:hypothetical protein
MTNNGQIMAISDEEGKSIVGPEALKALSEAYLNAWVHEVCGGHHAGGAGAGAGGGSAHVAVTLAQEKPHYAPYLKLKHMARRLGIRVRGGTPRDILERAVAERLGLSQAAIQAAIESK